MSDEMIIAILSCQHFTIIARLVLTFTIRRLPNLFLSLFVIDVDTFSHSSVLLMLPGDSCIVCQAAVETGSRWACWLSLQFYSRLRQLWSGACTQRPWGYPAIHPSIAPSRHQFTTVSIHLSFLHWICEQLALSCSVPAPSPPTVIEQWYRDRDNSSSMIAWSIYPTVLTHLTDCPISREGFTVSC